MEWNGRQILRWRLQGWKWIEDLVDGMESGLPSFQIMRWNGTSRPTLEKW